jgi:hypothetical protein
MGYDKLLGQRRFSRWLTILAPLAFYLILSFAFFARDVNWSKYFFGYATDSVMFIWFLNWWPFAISHGLNPFICKYVWFPAGYNLTWATSVSFFALLAWPVTALGSPVLSYNILMLSAPALAAWTAFLLARELTGDWLASLVCGLMFGFSAPELLQVMAELNLDSVCLIPLALLLGVRRVRGSLQRWPFVISLSFLLVVQLGMSTEVLASLCIVGALTWVIFLLFAPAGERSAYWHIAVDVALAAPLVMILAAPFLYYLVKGLPDFPATIHPSYFQQNDLLLYIISTLPIRSGWAALGSIAKQFAGFSPDNFTFASIPALLILIFYFYRYSRTAYVKALLVLICTIMLLSLGLRLEFNGKITHIPLPWMLLSHVPIIRSIGPYRFLTYFTLGNAIAAALWLTAAKTTPARVGRYALAGLACVLLPPAKVQVLRTPWQIQPIFAAQNEFKWSLWPADPFFTQEHIRQSLGNMPNVILLPAPVIGSGMAWQVNAGMSFTQAEGYVGYTLVPQQKWTDVLNDIAFGPQPDFDMRFPAYCAAHKVDYILIGPGAPVSVVRAIEAFGWPHHVDQGIEVVKVPADLPPS